MLEMVESAFREDLLSVSPKASRLADFAWLLYSIGGPVPVKAVSGHFDRPDDCIEILTKTGILRYALGGFMDGEQKRESFSLLLADDLASRLPAGITRKDFQNFLVREYGDRMMPYCRSPLTEQLSVMLTSIVYYATPARPVAAELVLKRAGKVSMKTYEECRDVMDYYMTRLLGLVTPEAGAAVNLSAKSQHRIMAFPKIWELYIREPQDRIMNGNGVETGKQEPPNHMSKKISEQEKKLRGYFPWLRLQ